MFDYTALWQKAAFLPYLFLALSTLSLWIKRHFFIWGALLLLGIISGFVTGRIEPLALVTIITLGYGYFLCFKTNNRFFQIQFGIISFVFSIAVFYHLMPGFHNLELVHQWQLTPDAIPFSLFLNFDKPLVGLFVLAFGWQFVNKRSVSKTLLRDALIIFILALITLTVFCLMLQFVRFEPKWNDFFYVWALDNLIFTCVSEEVLFRGLIQNSLSQWLKKLRGGPIIALCIASFLFGLAHYRGGILYIILSSIAGLFYGASYLRSQRIESSILTHFGVNLFHIVFLTYPALQ